MGSCPLWQRPGGTSGTKGMLAQPFTHEEVSEALLRMGPSKSPDIDGFTAGLFQKHEDLLKDSVSAAVLGFLNDGETTDEVDKTLLVLIPKVSNPQELTQL